MCNTCFVVTVQRDDKSSTRWKFKFAMWKMYESMSELENVFSSFPQLREKVRMRSI